LKWTNGNVSTDGQFPDTQWSMVLRAGGPSTPKAQHALDTLCTAYWYPIYAFIRRKGKDPTEALDLTQEYFQRLLEKGTLAAAAPGKGRFRAFLVADCSHFLIDEFRHNSARVRNPGTPLLSIDARSAEGRYLNEPAHALTPERFFERNWARTLLERVLERLQQEYERDGKSVRFDQLKLVLTEPSRSIPHAEIARRLRTTEAAVATAVHRLRQRFRAILNEEIAETVSDPADIDDEIRALFEALKAT
jgi:RNA polymerase sigma-70 factor (ECF subfamily)